MTKFLCIFHDISDLVSAIDEMTKLQCYLQYLLSQFINQDQQINNRNTVNNPMLLQYYVLCGLWYNPNPHPHSNRSDTLHPPEHSHTTPHR